MKYYDKYKKYKNKYSKLKQYGGYNLQDIEKELKLISGNKEKNKQDLQLLNEVWKIVTKFPDPAVCVFFILIIILINTFLF